MPLYNPHTGREIYRDGPTYTKLIKEGYSEDQLTKKPSAKALGKQKEVLPLLKKTKSKTKSTECVESTLKKYTSRPSPPFPANECCGQKRKGNNGNEYESIPNKKNICQWKVVPHVKMTNRKKLQKKKLPNLPVSKK